MPRMILPCIAVAATLLTSRANAFETRSAAGGQPVHWAGPSMTFVIDPSVEAAVPGGADGVKRALAMWSGVSGAPTITVTDGPPGGAVALDGRNTVLVAQDGDGPVGGALAVTVVHYAAETGEILDADIVIDGRRAFAVLADDARTESAKAVLVEGSGEGGGDDTPPFDLVHVVSHETGHALGLGDVQSQGAVMYAYSTPGDASYREPASDDVAGLRSVYGAQATAAGCRRASVGGASPAEGATWAALFVVLAAGVHRRARRRAHIHAGRP